MDENQAVIGITGASGQLGRRVVELAAERTSPAQIVALTRTPETLTDLAEQGVQVRKCDFADPSNLPNVLAGIKRLLLISVDDVREGVRPRLHGNAIEAARAAGVRHLLYTSAIKPHYSPILFLRDHASTEQLIVESGLDYTFLRNNFYMETVLQAGAQAVASGASYSATQGGAAAYVTREDCARVAAAVLTPGEHEVGHEGAVYDVTGPDAWSQEEIVRELKRVVGRTIAYVPVDEATLRQGMIAHNLPLPVVEMLVGIDRGIALGALDVVSHSVERLTGTPPETLPEFLERHRDALLNAAMA